MRGSSYYTNQAINRKIKIGQPGTQDEMLRKDCERISLIHKTIGKTFTPYTKNGKVLYYLDANGRYESKDTLLRFINHFLFCVSDLMPKEIVRGRI